MIDPAATFHAMRRTAGMAPLRERFCEDRVELLHAVLTMAEVNENAGFFEPMPPGRRPAKSRMRWVIAVRQGDVFAHRPPERNLGIDPYQRRCLEALTGREIIDLVCCDLKLARVTSRLLGVAPVLGVPQERSFPDDAPVRIYASPLSWLTALGDGVLPIGTEAETQHWLRGCAAGLVAESVPHAEALLLKMRREIPALPKLMVRAA